VSQSKYWAVICLISLASIWTASARAQNDPLRHGHALVIGASNYTDKQWPPLNDIGLQIRELQNSLRPHFDDVKVLADPTFASLDNTIREFLRSYGNNDDARLFIYYAGHGYTEVSADRNEYRGYITGTDTPYVDGTQSGFASARLKAISMEAIRGIVSDSNARQVLFVFDSCFAGTIFTARSPGGSRNRLTDAEIAQLLTRPVREFITAGDMQEKVPAHSPLPQLLENALKGDADPYGLGVVTGQQIGQYLWSHTRGIGISPREGKLPGYFDRGEFLFRVGLSKSTAGLRDSTSPPPPEFAANRLPIPTPSPSSPLPRSYLVLFDSQKPELNDHAREIIREAANSTKVQYSVIEVKFNSRSSFIGSFETGAVVAELVKDGVPESAIRSNGGAVVGAGPGVREPKDHVEIIIK
jgi:hypothetical protein